MIGTFQHCNPRSLIRLLVLAGVVLGLALPAPRPVSALAPNGEDYATSKLGRSWDFSSTEEFAFEFTRDRGNNGGAFSDLKIENGVLSGTGGNDPRIFLTIPSDPNVNPVRPEGGFKPIDAATYKFLTVRLRLANSSMVQVTWQAAMGSAFGGSKAVTISGGDWRTLTFDLTDRSGGANLGYFGAPWSGTMQGIYLDPANSPGKFEIDFVRLTSVQPQQPANIPPALAITAPSYISGPDYATEQLGNPWDFADVGDVVSTRSLEAISYGPDGMAATSVQQGERCGSVVCGDAQVTLNLGPPIDTSRYKYLTYRMKLDGPIDTINGSVGRLLWWTTRPEEATVTKDFVLYEGWRTVSFDLTKVRAEAGNGQSWAASAPIAFRFDPHEFAAPHTHHLAYIMLTGDSVASASYDIRYQANNPDGDAPAVSFFYDSDAAGFDGQAITCGTDTAPAPAGQNQIYLPLVVRSSLAPAVVPTGATCRWDVSQVPAGSYYIYGVASDGAYETRVYSETPLIVSR